MDCRCALFGKLVAASPLLPPPIGVEDVSIKHPRRRVHHALVQERCRDVAQVRGLQLQEGTGVASAGLSLHACARSRKCVRPVVGTRLVIRILPEVFCHLQPAKCQMSRPLTHQPYGYSPFSRTLNPRLKHNLGGQSINKHAQHIVARFGPEQRRTHPDLSLPILLAVSACQSNVGVLFGTCACAHLLCESVNARVKESARESALDFVCAGKRQVGPTVLLYTDEKDEPWLCVRVPALPYMHVSDSLRTNKKAEPFQ